MRDILTELTTALDQQRPCVYCAVVETRGSTPQKAGAAMLVFPDGGQRGTLGGGCVEAEVRQRALAAMGNRRPDLHTFHLDDNYGWDDGLICGGRMTILAEPMAPEAAGYYRTLRDLIERGRGCTEAVAVADPGHGAPVGSRYLFDADGRLAAQRYPGSVPGDVTAHLSPLGKRPRPATHHGL